MTQASPAFAADYELKSLPFDPSKLDGLSEKLIRSYWENNHGSSVKALNAVKQKLVAALADADIPPFIYNDLKREHLMRTGSVVFHELYFANLGGSGKPDASLHNDHELLQQGLNIYDALYAWCKNVHGEQHSWNPQAL